MHLLITGSNGLLGQKLLATLNKDANELFGFDLADQSYTPLIPHRYFKVDLIDRKQTTTAIQNINPEIIIHTAAMTGVDQCETERENCWKINVSATADLIKTAEKINSKFIFISSDYIFDGKNGPYNEESLPNPINYYGRSKLAAENLLRGSKLDWTIVRTIVLYGVGINVRASFVTWLLKELREHRPVRIVHDQWGNTTIADDLATGIDRIITLKREGIYNIADHGYMTRYEFALMIAERFNLDRGLITPVSSSAFKQPAMRPLRSGLDASKAERELFLTVISLTDALDLYKYQEKQLNN